ncbi:hypothetical protein IWQ60_008296 [Tieghemiomyces parasiticus]|uniref:Ribosomal protein S6 n=1 Tax=Tieghemiomyces parasiticus TaxID=78921 RepID=A0A9W8DRQ7_9FUNG|nr:hypothetical protein IWQ60_008296 [Tieghemiomyces parasiticus]
MPLYELLCISSRNIATANARDLVKMSALTVLDRGGVVRGFTNFGIRVLPHRIKRHQQYFEEGRYWLMHFDCNPLVLTELTKSLRLDPRVLRHNVLKLDNKLAAYKYNTTESPAATAYSQF